MGGQEKIPSCLLYVCADSSEEWLFNADRVCSNCPRTEFIILKRLGHLGLCEFLYNTIIHSKQKKTPTVSHSSDSSSLLRWDHLSQSKLLIAADTWSRRDFQSQNCYSRQQRSFSSHPVCRVGSRMEHVDENYLEIIIVLVLTVCQVVLPALCVLCSLKSATPKKSLIMHWSDLFHFCKTYNLLAADHSI